MAYGDLGAVIDTLAYFDGSARCNESCLVVGETCASTCHWQSYNTPCSTYSIDSLGNISDSVIDTLNINDNVSSDRARFAKLTDSLYALATPDNHWKMQLDTWQILANGQMADTVIDHHLFPPEYYRPGSLKKVGPGMLALASEDHGALNGHIWTILVYLDGTIEHDLVDSLIFTTTGCIAPRFSNPHPGIWAITSQGWANYGTVATVSITAGGLISPSLIDSLTFREQAVFVPTSAKAHGDFVAIAYRAANDFGTLAIVEISDTGVITDSVIDTYVFESGICLLPFVHSIGQGYIGVAYRDGLAHGILKTFLVDENGSLNNTTIDTLDFAPGGCNFPYVFHVTGDVWAVVHDGADIKGWVTTFGLETPPPPARPRDLMRGMLR